MDVQANPRRKRKKKVIYRYVRLIWGMLHISRDKSHPFTLFFPNEDRFHRVTRKFLHPFLYLLMEILT